VGIPSTVVAVGLLLGAAGGPAAAEGAPSSLLRDLLPATSAHALGFPKVSSPPAALTKTGVNGCPSGAREAFEDAAGRTGVVSEVIACRTEGAGQQLLASAKKSGRVVKGFAVPSPLGPTAFVRAGTNSTYVIFWQRGDVVELTSLDTHVTSGSSTSGASTHPLDVPPTAQQRGVLATVASEQNARAR
jgi:hypothetical protein